MRRLALVPLAISMLLFSPAASALGLGEIEMQSALNQRLDAEIPLRGVPEDDSSRIIVSLASEQAFRQVGLQRPFSLTRLSFEVKQRESGEYYIQVTSREPIVEPFLSFLIEVDWPDGNLLREYTVLLDPPVFVSDTREAEPAATEPEPARAVDEQPVDSVAGADVPTEIERDVEPEPAPEPETAAEDEAQAATAGDVTAAETRRTEGDFSDTPVFLQVEQAEERAEAEARAIAEAEAETETEAGGEAEPDVSASGYETGGGDYGPVQRGEALWNIASRLKSGDMTVQQMMLALLRYNPEAFVDNNINRLKQGYVLRIPDAGAVLSLSAQQAVARVREQNSLWQEYRRAVAGGTGRAERQQTVGTEAAAEAVAGDDADLRIVGSEEGTGAGSEQEASATSGGTQVSEDLKLARERLESARMEKAELESRVEELEETAGKMERLIELREDQLAKLQDQLRRIEEGADPAEVLAETEDAATEEAVDAEPAADDAGEEATRVAETVADATDTGQTATTGADTDAEAADTEMQVAEEETAGEATADEATADEDTEEVAERTGTEQADTAADDDSGVVTVRTQPSEPGILDQVGGFFRSVGQTIGGLVAGLGLGGLIPEPFVLPAAGGIVVLLLLGAMLAVRRRRSGLEEEGAGEEAVVDAEAASIFAAGEDEAEEDFSGLFDEDDDRTAADDAGLTDRLEAEASELAGADETATDAESELMSESFDLEGLEDRDQPVSVDAESADDTIAEADVYLAYGLHQQAEDLLNLAIEEQPDRVDYRAKLLEAIYAEGRSEDFVEQARALRERVESTDSDPNWLRVVAMGQELAPSEEMFQQQVDSSLKPAAGATQVPETDLELDGEEDAADLDFSFDEEGSGEADQEIDETDDDTFARTMMVDSDTLAGEEAEAGSAESVDTDGEMDFDLGDLEVGEEGEEVTDAEDEGTDFDLSDLDLGEEEAEAVPTDSGASGAETAAGEDETTDFDLSDLDLGDEEAAPTESQAPAAEPAGDEDESTDFDLSDLDLGDEEAESVTAEEDEGADSDLSGLDRDDETEDAPKAEEAAAPDELGPADFDDGDTGKPEKAVSAGEGEDFDFDLDQDESGGSEAAAEEETADAGGIDLGDLELEAEKGPGDESGIAEPTESTESVTGEAELDFDLSEDEQADAGEIDLGGLELEDDGSAGEESEADQHLATADSMPEEDAGITPDADESAEPEDRSGLADLDSADPEGSRRPTGAEPDAASVDVSLEDSDVDVSVDDLPADLAEDDSGLVGPGEEASPDSGPDASAEPAASAEEDDEYDTMLDLARAYIDMGDAESARSALEEVAESGSEDQRSEAQSLLDSV